MCVYLDIYFVTVVLFTENFTFSPLAYNRLVCVHGMFRCVKFYMCSGGWRERVKRGGDRRL